MALAYLPKANYICLSSFYASRYPHYIQTTFYDATDDDNLQFSLFIRFFTELFRFLYPDGSLPECVGGHGLWLAFSISLDRWVSFICMNHITPLLLLFSFELHGYSGCIWYGVFAYLDKACGPCIFSLLGCSICSRNFYGRCSGSWRFLLS